MESVSGPDHAVTRDLVDAVQKGQVNGAVNSTLKNADNSALNSTNTM